MLPCLMALFGKVPAAVAKAPSVTPSLMPATLGLRQIAAALSLVVVIGGIGLTRLGLKGLARQLLVACARCTLQLQLLGGLVLQWLLPSSQPCFIVAWILGIGIIAAQESYGRLEYSYPHLRWHLTVSVLLGGVAVLCFAMGMELFGKLQPWYKPQTIIPVAGMLFGNTLSAVTLAASSLTRSFATDQAQVELLLTRGGTYEEAILPLTKESIQMALTPTINALSVTGIVHLPGMMTGQILAGQSPRQAAVYQTLIWFLIASVAAATVQLLTALVSRALVDTQQHRLRIDKMVNIKASKEDKSDPAGLDATPEDPPIKVAAAPLNNNSEQTQGGIRFRPSLARAKLTGRASQRRSVI
jgi:putative ABC transport system permease protein